jgi:hypothetical protein
MESTLPMRCLAASTLRELLTFEDRGYARSAIDTDNFAASP